MLSELLFVGAILTAFMAKHLIMKHDKLSHDRTCATCKFDSPRLRGRRNPCYNCIKTGARSGWRRRWFR